MSKTYILMSLTRSVHVGKQMPCTGPYTQCNQTYIQLVLILIDTHPIHLFGLLKTYLISPSGFYFAYALGLLDVAQVLQVPRLLHLPRVCEGAARHAAQRDAVEHSEAGGEVALRKERVVDVYT